MMMLIRGVRVQVLYLVSTFRVLPDPGFDVMDAILVYFSVSLHMSLPFSPLLICSPDSNRVSIQQGLSFSLHCGNH